ncbi:MAG: GIY-YIG nuclease family protein [Patescibacteria group bacterium]|jgi:putative endonuclease
MWFVYGLTCKDNSLYIGSTNNIKRRIKEHQQGKSLGIKGRLPVKLSFYIAIGSEKVARSLEKYLKSGSGKAIIKKRILGDEAH